MTDHFLEAQNLPNLEKGPENKDFGVKTNEASRKSQVEVILCNSFGHLAPDCRTPPKKLLKCKLCGKTGHIAETCRNQQGDNKPSSSCARTESEPAQPRSRKLSRRRGGKTSFSRRQSEENLQNAVQFLVDGMPVVKGVLIGKEVQVLHNTGCNTKIVQRKLVPDVCLTGKSISIVLLDGSIAISRKL